MDDELPIARGRPRCHALVMSYVIVEIMPEQHRSSHRAAGNWGVYPRNGAVREIMTEEEAEIHVVGDEYDYIVGTLVGAKVEAGEPDTEDYDTGRVLDRECDRPGCVWVAWSCGESTETPIETLRLP